MGDIRPWKEYTEIAEKTLNRCNMTNPHSQTIDYVAVMLWTESRLADLEKDISEISSVNPLHWFRLRRARNEYAKLSSTAYHFQRTTSNPGTHLHRLIDIDVSKVENRAISQILTQLGWEFFPRHLNRFLSSYERVGRQLNSKKQQLLTTCVILVSFVALLISMATLIVTALV